MHRTFSFVALAALAGSAAAQDAASPSSGLQSSNVLNPNISAVGWFQGEIEDASSGSALVKEVELAFQSVVDPFARADVFAALEPGAVDLEEAYLTWYRLPLDLQLKVGKFKASVGRFNRLHTPETEFADRPLVHDRFFGDEGLAAAGASLSWHVPNPWLLVELTAEGFQAPEAGDSPVLERARRKDLFGVGRLSAYHDLTEAANVAVGASYASGKAPGGGDDSELLGADLTFRWKNPRRAIYRSLLWRTEGFWGRHEFPAGTQKPMGYFTHLEWQFARRWRTGGRYDWSHSPGAPGHRSGGLAYLTFAPSEFSLVSLQGRTIEPEAGPREYAGFLKATFNIGPHGTHPF